MTYKQHWAYKQVAKNYPVKVLKKSVTIYFDKSRKDVYAKFDIKHLVDDDIDCYAVYLDGKNLELEFEHPTDDYELAVVNALIYFNDRF